MKAYSIDFREKIIQQIFRTKYQFESLSANVICLSRYLPKKPYTKRLSTLFPVPCYSSSPAREVKSFLALENRGILNILP
jgi:hypothetical protein